jgi:hypothetical protein
MHWFIFQAENSSSEQWHRCLLLPQTLWGEFWNLADGCQDIHVFLWSFLFLTNLLTPPLGVDYLGQGSRRGCGPGGCRQCRLSLTFIMNAPVHYSEVARPLLVQGQVG